MNDHAIDNYKDDNHYHFYYFVITVSILVSAAVKPLLCMSCRTSLRDIGNAKPGNLAELPERPFLPFERLFEYGWV